MNEILLKLAVGQIAHQATNRQRLVEIIELTEGKGDQLILNGVGSYIAGAVGPLVVTLCGDDPEQLPKLIERINAISELILSARPR